MKREKTAHKVYQALGTTLKVNNYNLIPSIGLKVNEFLVNCGICMAQIIWYIQIFRIAKYLKSGNDG